MTQQMNKSSNNCERLKFSGALADGRAPWHERFMAALACASESNLRQLNVLLRTGLGVVFLFEVATWMEIVRFDPAIRYTAQPFFIFDLALVGAGFGLTYFKWFGANWRSVTMALCVILVSSRTLLALVIGQDEPLLLALFVLALGTAVLVPWSARWQGLITLTGMLAFAVAAVGGVVESADLHRWMLLAAVAAFALSFTALKDYYRAQAILIETLLEKEKRLAGSETMLRKLFDAVPDIVTLTRFSDGKLFEVNEEFLRRSGLSREQALATSTLEVAAWSSMQVRAAYIERLKKQGQTRNYETEFRLQGVLAPYLLSSVVVEIEGDLYALNVARDAISIRENQRALREAQDLLHEQVEELTATEERLRNEVADRRQAQARVAKSEAILRRMFDAIPDIVITRLNDAIIDVNEEFVKRTGISRVQALAGSINDFPIFLHREDREEFLRRVRGRRQNHEFRGRLHPQRRHRAPPRFRCGDRNRRRPDHLWRLARHFRAHSDGAGTNRGARKSARTRREPNPSFSPACRTRSAPR